MKPETILPASNNERLVVKPDINIEKNNKQNLEKVAEYSAEKFEQVAENSAIAADVSKTTILPTPVSEPSNVDNNTTEASLSSVPLVANDDDLIEKEWVDRAKKIVSDTQNDPHRRENEVSKLQIDYIKKRFGRDLGDAA